MTNETPAFVERDPDVIMSECKAQLEEILGRELQPAQLEQLMLQFIVYREVLLLNRFNAAMSQMLYQFSKAPVLDYIAGLVAVERLPPASAGCTVRFTLVPGHGNVLLPEGTRVATSDSEVIFSVTDDYLISPTINTIDVEVLAEISGKSGNGYEPGAVNKILDPLAFVSTVENLNVTGGGSDEETDEQLRERIKLAPSQFSTSGSRQSYIFHAKGANAAITDISVFSYKPDNPHVLPIGRLVATSDGIFITNKEITILPGMICIVPLAESEHYERIIGEIYNTCSPEKVRPLSDTVIVSAPEKKEYDIEVNLILLENADATDVQNQVISALNEYAKEHRKKLGRDIVRSHIAKICRIESVYDVEVVSPGNNIIVADGEFANCAQITVNMNGFNHG